MPSHHAELREMKKEKYPDPRLRSDFKAEFLPRCDGGALPFIETSDRYERLMIEFAAAYYALNEAITRLESARRAKLSEADLEAALQAATEASGSRDALEDRCAVEGFFAEPKMEKELYVDLEFMWAGKSKRPRIHRQEFKAKFVFEI